MLGDRGPLSLQVSSGKKLINGALIFFFFSLIRFLVLDSHTSTASTAPGVQKAHTGLHGLEQGCGRQGPPTQSPKPGLLHASRAANGSFV